MNRSVWTRTGIAAAVVLMSAMGHVGVANAAEGDSLSLKIANALRSDRVFMRAGAIYVNVKTKSGDAYDVTGPVMTRDDIANALVDPDGDNNTLTANEPRSVILWPGPPAPAATPGRINAVANALTGSLGAQLLVDQMDALGITSIGTPAGVKAESAKGMGTLAFSVGSFLDDDHTWAVEAYVLAAPLSTSVYGRGTTVRTDGDGNEYVKPLGIDGQKIVTTKLLPPSVVLGKYWGSKNARFRPFTGVMGTYTIFYNTKATELLNSYQGGSNPGDTTVSIKNTFGAGPVLGLQYNIDEDWHLSLNVGRLKLKTTATLVTRNTLITSKTGAIYDLGKLSDTIQVGEETFTPGSQSGANNGQKSVVALNGGLTTLISKGVLFNKGQQNFGTFVRKSDVELTNTLYMLSIGRHF